MGEKTKMLAIWTQMCLILVVNSNKQTKTPKNIFLPTFDSSESSFSSILLKKILKMTFIVVLTVNINIYIGINSRHMLCMLYSF